MGEVNGSHGVTRPGGSALNAGQCGAFRAAEYIANIRKDWSIDLAEAEQIAAQTEQSLTEKMESAPAFDWRTERKIFQHRMSTSAAFVREQGVLEQALTDAEAQLERLSSDGLQGNTAEILRNQQLLRAQILYLKAIIHQTAAGVGSRGSSLVLSDDGKAIHPKLDWKIQPEDEAFRKVCQVFENDDFVWEDCRPVPDPDGWFETLWKDYREGGIYGKGTGK